MQQDIETYVERQTDLQGNKRHARTMLKARIPSGRHSRIMSACSMSQLMSLCKSQAREHPDGRATSQSWPGPGQSACSAGRLGLRLVGGQLGDP